LDPDLQQPHAETCSDQLDACVSAESYRHPLACASIAVRHKHGSTSLSSPMPDGGSSAASGASPMDVDESADTTQAESRPQSTSQRRWASDVHPQR
jgi:hypothetical protein